ncbi:IS21-like element helper ATPase IstB [Persicobacter sp. CCB-QB2]|uniref:IS21-like element helper ATPase IstB n=1 Tax=Persicobacter sp. CCB-QB2 TaxID=1561025 RepID=UPI000A3DA9C6|nr:IS21-like element helper ATPase IstB [Persicobacter sp. CCB-QB2]
MRKSDKERIIELSRELRLPALRNNFTTLAAEAAENNLDYEDYLLAILEKEFINRNENRKKNIIRRAGFPSKSYLSLLERTFLPKAAQKKLPVLERLEFIDQGQNIIMAGNPGTGKTHIAIGLGLKACEMGYSVYFTTIHALLTLLRESHSQKALRQIEVRFEKYDLVICDEVGYVSFDKAGAELLFNHLSLRAGRKSTIITTNLDFERWHEIFLDPVLTAALIDRLTHKAHLINMDGESYRLRETMNLTQQA